MTRFTEEISIFGPDTVANTLIEVPLVERRVLAHAIREPEWAVELLGTDLEMSDGPQRLAYAAIKGILLTGGDLDLFAVAEWVNEAPEAAAAKKHHDRDLGKHVIQLLVCAELSYLSHSEYRSQIRILEHATLAKRARFITDRLAARAEETPSKAQPLIQEALVALAGLIQGKNKAKTSMSLGEALRQEVGRIRAGEDSIALFGTPWNVVNERTSAIGAAQFIVLAAWPKTGKTTFAFQWARHIGRTTGQPVFFWEGEMAIREMARRGMAAMLGKPIAEIQEHELDVILRMAGEEDHLQIDCSGGKLKDFAAAVHLWMLLHPDTIAIFVDYVGLLQDHTAKTNATTAANEVSDFLMGLAKHYQIPVIAMQQPNRDVRQRLNKAPVVTDLRDSNKLLQDAHKIWFLHRPSDFDSNYPEDLVELHNLADRNGKTCVIELFWEPETFTFHDGERGARPPSVDFGQTEFEEEEFEIPL